MADPAGWDWFAARSAPVPGEDPAPSFARCFSTADGERVLAALKAMTLERTLGPEAPDSALRHLEGQRVLVATILALAARGRGAAP